MKVWAHDLYFIPVGTNWETTFDGYQCRGIRIDNLSNSWLYVHQIQRYVPPLVTGWQAYVTPSQVRLNIDFATAPSGGIASSNTGGPVTVETHEQPLPNSDGYSFGTIALQNQPTINRFETFIAPADGTLLITPAPPKPTQQWIIVYASINDAFDALSNQPIAQEVRVTVGDSALTPPNIVRLAISPSHPSDYRSFYPYGVGTRLVGQSVHAICQCLESGNPRVNLMLHFYLFQS